MDSRRRAVDPDGGGVGDAGSGCIILSGGWGWGGLSNGLVALRQPPTIGGD